MSAAAWLGIWTWVFIILYPTFNISAWPDSTCILLLSESWWYSYIVSGSRTLALPSNSLYHTKFSRLVVCSMAFANFTQATCWSHLRRGTTVNGENVSHQIGRVYVIFREEHGNFRRSIPHVMRPWVLMFSNVPPSSAAQVNVAHTWGIHTRKTCICHSVTIKPHLTSL